MRTRLTCLVGASPISQTGSSMAQASLPSCIVTHYFADHHSRLFWEAKDAGREYSVEYVTILDFRETSKELLVAIHKKSIPIAKRRFGQKYAPESGLAVITATITDLLDEGTWQQAAVTYNEGNSAILICRYALDETSIAAFNAIAIDVLEQFNLTAVMGDEVIEAAPWL